MFDGNLIKMNFCARLINVFGHEKKTHKISWGKKSHVRNQRWKKEKQSTMKISEEKNLKERLLKLNCDERARGVFFLLVLAIVLAISQRQINELDSAEHKQ